MQVQGPRRRSRWVVWVPITIVAVLLVCGAGGIGAYFYLRDDDSWFALDGLPAPGPKLARAATVTLPGGTKRVAATADGSTVYYAAVTGTGLKIGAGPITGEGRRWIVDRPLGGGDATTTLTVAGEVVLVAVSDFEGQRSLVVLRTSDGTEVWADTWVGTVGNVYAALAGTDLFTARPGADSRSGVVRRVDVRTGTEKWAYTVPDATVSDLVPMTSWFGGRSAGREYRHPGESLVDTVRDGLPVDTSTLVARDARGTVHVIDGESGAGRIRRNLPGVTSVYAVGGQVYGVVTRDDTAVAAYDLETLTRQWGTDIADPVAVQSCGPTQVCVQGGTNPGQDVFTVLDAASGLRRGEVGRIGADAPSRVVPLGGRFAARTGGASAISDRVDPWSPTQLTFQHKDLFTLGAIGRTLVVGRLTTAGPGGGLGWVVCAVDMEGKRVSGPFYDKDIDPSIGVMPGGRYLMIPTERQTKLVVLRNPFA